VPASGTAPVVFIAIGVVSGDTVWFVVWNDHRADAVAREDL
jgi:hypothetical protein